MSNTEEFKAGEEQGMIVSELKSLNQSFTEMKQGIGKKMDRLEDVFVQNAAILARHESEIVNLQQGVKDWFNVKSWIVRTVFFILIGALMTLIIKK